MVYPNHLTPDPVAFQETAATIGVRGGGARGAAAPPVPKFFGQNAWNSGNKPSEKKENKPTNLNITFKTNYINKKRIGNLPSFVVQKSKFLIHLLSFPLANCCNHVRFSLQILRDHSVGFSCNQLFYSLSVCARWTQCKTLKQAVTNVKFSGQA